MGLARASELRGMGRLEDAEAECRREASAAPSDYRPLHLLGVILHERGKVDEALRVIEQAVAVAPGTAALRVNFAALLGRRGRLVEALGQLRHAVRLGGDLPELHNNIGVCLEKLGRATEAVSAYRAALQRRPDYAEASFNLANALRQAGDLAAAARQYQQTLGRCPGYSKAHEGLAITAVEAGDADAAVSHYQAALAMQPLNAMQRSLLLYTLHYLPNYGPQALYDEHRLWAKLFGDPLAEKIVTHHNDRARGRKLRVGYVSPDLRRHTVTKFITSALEHHDTEQFELFCYSDVEKPDDITARLKGIVEHWAETRGTNDNALAQRIRQDRIDILVDLRGHAADNRLPMFCLKPAPIQVNMVGYFDTTGLSTMDYRITDEHQDPTGRTEQYHTEKLIRIEPSCWCYTADEDAPELAEPPALKNGFVTFGSLNKIVKVSEPCARMWAAVLDAVPPSTSSGRGGSKLLLSVVSADAAGTVRKRLESYGLPLERLIITDKTRTRREYLHRFNEIDIALDTWPFNGITTTCDGLWMGVPCVSMTGNTSVSRAGKSILHAAGLGELATESPERFVAVASELVQDVDRLAAMRRSMRQRLLASTLMDHRGFARKLEAAYRDIWRAWCSQPRRRVDAGPH